MSKYKTGISYVNTTRTNPYQYLTTDNNTTTVDYTYATSVYVYYDTQCFTTTILEYPHRLNISLREPGKIVEKEETQPEVIEEKQPGFCNVCKSEVKERMLFNTKYIGCLC